MYLYGYGRSGFERIRDEIELVSFAEGAACNAMVVETPAGTSLRVNGKVDASDGEDMKAQLGLAYLPRFLAPQAREVLVIGFGSGTTAGASLLFPDTRVTCLEIEEAVFEASRHFHDVNHRPEESPRFKMILDDGRAHVQGTEELYDLILSEPSNPWMAGTSNLHTLELYQAARARLAPGGVLAQWMHLQNITAAEYAIAARTLRSVFPQCALIRVSDLDTLLVASLGEVIPDSARLDAAQALVDDAPAVLRDLERWFASTDVRAILLEHLLLDQAGLDDLIGRDEEGVVNTDLNMRLELDAPLSLFGARRVSEQSARRALFEAIRAQWLQDAWRQWGCGPAQLDAWRRLRTLLFQNGQAVLASNIVELALSVDPQDPDFAADKLRLDLRLERFEFDIMASWLAQEDPARAWRVGRELAMSGDQLGSREVLERARFTFEQLLLSWPESPTTLTSLAIVYARLGMDEEAGEAARRAFELDPLNELTRQTWREYQRRTEGGGD